MDATKCAYYEMKFKIAYLEKGGNEFQNFFSEIMEKCHPGDFQRVRPWGSMGDRKNDGYLRSEHAVFQVYAPNQMDAREAIAKINEDFYGALKHWGKYIDKWVFVHNARDGVSPQVLDKLLELDAAHSAVTVCSWGFEELRQKVFTLNEADMASLLGYAPSGRDILDIRYDNVQEVLNNVARQKPRSFQDIRPVPSGKLKFNRLSEDVQILLTSGMWKADFVGQFFNDYPKPQYGDEIALAFKKEYERYKIINTEPDTIFAKLQDFAGGSEKGTPAYQAAVLAVLAYLFEQCDIFERSLEEGMR